jgi:two-component system, OmpR family, response regulator ChvI
MPAGAGRIAVVDDEEHIRETVGFALQREGYRVDTYADGLAAWTAFERELPDLVVLDILMPHIDGLELCRKLRGRSEVMPIIFLTSRDEELDRVLGLELGADDYLCKPFSVRELIARVKVLFRRLALAATPETDASSVRRVGPLALDGSRHQVHWGDVAVPLTVSEFRILDALARRPGHVKSRAQLVEEAYPDDAWVSERNIDSHIKRMRRKFQEVDAAFDAIETIYGLGYRYRTG